MDPISFKCPLVRDFVFCKYYLELGGVSGWGGGGFGVVLGVVFVLVGWLLGRG